ncbi:MAG: hypothetical protein NT014_06795 [Candidatus Omnitrophica bacterium]|nr:hypothetical protein [Candidatus Omnitrophota bacterium]
MKQENKVSVAGRIKSFFVKLFDNIDKKMEAEAKSKSCCCKPSEGKDKSCCS